MRAQNIGLVSDSGIFEMVDYFEEGRELKQVEMSTTILKWHASSPGRI